MLTLTETAAGKVKELLQEEGRVAHGSRAPKTGAGSGPEHRLRKKMGEDGMGSSR